MTNSTHFSQRLRAMETESAPSSPHEQSCEIRIARSENDRRAAALLVGRMYRAEGYLDQQADNGMAFFGSHHALKQTTVFVAEQHGQVVGTIAVVLDSAAGLPLDCLYAREIATLRMHDKTPSEICSLAVDPGLARGGTRLVLQLFRQATLFLVNLTSATDALVTLKPSHRRFYKRCLGFEDFGSLTYDARFENAETVAMRLTRETVEHYGRDASVGSKFLEQVYGRATEAELRKLNGTVPARAESFRTPVAV